MALTANNNYSGVDLPIPEIILDVNLVTTSPENLTTRARVLVNDQRGTSRYIYVWDSTIFWRYDTYTGGVQLLAAPGITANTLSSAVFDPSLNRIWCHNGSSFSYYDIAADTWTSRATASGPNSSGAILTHPDTTYEATTASDDFIYALNQNSTSFYRYSISGNTWSSMTACPSATGSAGGGLAWSPYDVNRIYRIRGGYQTTVDYYSISGNSWTGVTPVPARDLWGQNNGLVPRGMSLTSPYLIHRPRLVTAVEYMQFGQLNTNTLDQTRVGIHTLWLDPHAESLLAPRMVYVKDLSGLVEYMYYLMSDPSTSNNHPLMCRIPLIPIGQ